MTKAKYIIAVLFASLILLIVPNISNAAVTVTRNIESKTTMKYSVSGLNLNEEHEYEYGFSATKAAEVKNWYKVTEYSTTSATVTLRLSDGNMKEVFDATDTGYLTLRDITDGNKIVVEPTTIDLKIPYLLVTDYTVINNGMDFTKRKDFNCRA